MEHIVRDMTSRTLRLFVTPRPFVHLLRLSAVSHLQHWRSVCRTRRGCRAPGCFSGVNHIKTNLPCLLQLINRQTSLCCDVRSHFRPTANHTVLVGSGHSVKRLSLTLSAGPLERKEEIYPSHPCPSSIELNTPRHFYPSKTIPTGKSPRPGLALAFNALRYR
ncbi:hypothetical protein J6590_002213 [Homalodisca vitripennis]|nr:hypothetical protein J6590_002213 [Homalodisca vitripennis]